MDMKECATDSGYRGQPGSMLAIVLVTATPLFCHCATTSSPRRKMVASPDSARMLFVSTDRPAAETLICRADGGILGEVSSGRGLEISLPPGQAVIVALSSDRKRGHAIRVSVRAGWTYYVAFATDPVGLFGHAPKLEAIKPGARSWPHREMYALASKVAAEHEKVIAPLSQQDLGVIHDAVAELKETETETEFTRTLADSDGVAHVDHDRHEPDLERDPEPNRRHVESINARMNIGFGVHSRNDVGEVALLLDVSITPVDVLSLGTIGWIGARTSTGSIHVDLHILNRRPVGMSILGQGGFVQTEKDGGAPMFGGGLALGLGSVCLNWLLNRARYESRNLTVQQVWLSPC